MSTATATAPTHEDPVLSELQVISGNSLVGSARLFPDSTYQQQLIHERYPQYEWIINCTLKEESTYCQTAHIRGDSGLAYGCFQIHIHEHPITEWCAMDFGCAMDYFIELVKEGKGSLWTGYRTCMRL